MWKKGTGIINEYEWQKSYILFPYFILVLINECTSKNQPHHKGMLCVAANGAHSARAYTDFRACLHENRGSRVGGVTCLQVHIVSNLILPHLHHDGRGDNIRDYMERWVTSPKQFTSPTSW